MTADKLHLLMEKALEQLLNKLLTVVAKVRDTLTQQFLRTTGY